MVTLRWKRDEQGRLIMQWSEERTPKPDQVFDLLFCQEAAAAASQPVHPLPLLTQLNHQAA